MNTHRFALKAIATIAVAASCGFAAADTQSVGVTATVNGVCKFKTGAVLSADFAPINPSSGGTLEATVAVPYQCTKGLTPTITAPSSTGTLTRTAGGTMSYGIAITGITAGTGFSSGAVATSASFTATLLPAAYQDAVAGDYASTVVLTMNN